MSVLKVYIALVPRTPFNQLQVVKMYVLLRVSFTNNVFVRFTNKHFFNFPLVFVAKWYAHAQFHKMKASQTLLNKLNVHLFVLLLCCTQGDLRLEVVAVRHQDDISHIKQYGYLKEQCVMLALLMMLFWLIKTCMIYLVLLTLLLKVNVSVVIHFCCRISSIVLRELMVVIHHSQLV